MKGILFIFFLFISLASNANMSSPYIPGTGSGIAFSSKDIDILGEKIHIVIDKNFSTAKFIVEYTISSQVPGIQIPLLFYAQDYKDSFRVWVDSSQVALQAIPEKYIQIKNTPLDAFAYTLDKKHNGDIEDYVSIPLGQHDSYTSSIKDLKYFETNLNKGVHKIHVEYIAETWRDISGWITQYSFRYSLAPAKYWKSFGTLEVNVEQEGEVRQYTTNLSQSKENSIQKINTWSFDHLSADYIELIYTPKSSPLARIFIAIGPLGFTFIFGGLLFALHVWFVRKCRRKFVQKKYSWVVILGSWIIPFLALLIFMFSYNLIDDVIGKNAGRHHGYVFLVFIFYPIIVLFYWPVMWLTDIRIKQKILKTTEKNG